MFTKLSDRVYVYADICNVYVLVSGTRALLIDVGSGSVLSALDQIGVQEVEWVLHTHGHRDQSAGDALLKATGTRFAVPRGECASFERVEDFWRTHDQLDEYDLTSPYNSSIRNVHVDRILDDYDRFSWRDIELTVLPVPGHTRGSVTYAASIDGATIGFCGDLIYDAGRIWTIHDLQWDYDEPDALSVALHSVHSLRQYHFDRLCPSHGSTITSPDHALSSLEDNLRALLTVVGVRMTLAMVAPVEPTTDQKYVEITRHLVGVVHPASNFYILRSDSGPCLYFDYGFPSLIHIQGGIVRFVEHSIAEVSAKYGLPGPEVMVPTHYHDDHVAGANHLREKFGTAVWASDYFSEILENPYDLRLPATWRHAIPVGQVLTEAGGLHWREFDFDVRHNPGHTWYAAAYFGEVDGVRVAVTGDEILMSGVGTLRGGGPVYRNRMDERGYMGGIEAVLEYKPDVLLSGHHGPLEVTPADLNALYRWARDLSDCWRRLAPPNMVGFAIDPMVVSIRPYESWVRAGEAAPLNVAVRNYQPYPAEVHIQLVPPDGWTVTPPDRVETLQAGERREFGFCLLATGDAVVDNRAVVLADVSIGDIRHGPIGECLITLVQMSENDSHKSHQPRTLAVATGSQNDSTRPAADI